VAGKRTEEYRLMTADLIRLRDELTARLGISDPRVADAFRRVPRHLFVPEVSPEDAYRDEAIVTRRDAAGIPVSSSSQPAIMAIMVDQLDLAPGHRVLEIGAGTGYNAALIREVVGPSGLVVSIDIDPSVAKGAAEHLVVAGYQDVTVLAADGAAGCPALAPFDRMIASVGVSDLAPAWLNQLAPDPVLVVPLDVRGAQVSVAFEARDGGRWASRSVVPCGFMRMRGALAGAETPVPLGPGLRTLLPEGRFIDEAALAAALAGPPAATEPAGVTAGAPEVFWALNLWLAAHEPRACEVAEEYHPGHEPRLAGAHRWGGRAFQVSYGIVADASIAVLVQDPDAELRAVGYGPDAAELAASLAMQVRAWQVAGRPGADRLHVDAYPEGATARPDPDVMIIERPRTRFAIYHE
jgi:protein-L-isoaspartate(D-aspartate) O-methyltransferase